MPVGAGVFKVFFENFAVAGAGRGVMAILLSLLILFILLAVGGDEFVGVSQGDYSSFCKERQGAKLVEDFAYHGFVGIDDQQPGVSFLRRYKLVDKLGVFCVD